MPRKREESGSRRKPRASASREQALRCARICDEKKAEDIVVLNLRKLTFLTDYFVIASTRSERQSRAIGDEVRLDFKGRGVRLLGAQGIDASKWALLDFGDVVLHLMLPEQRAFYDLEGLWADAARVKWSPSRPRRARDGSRASASDPRHPTE